MEQKKAQFDCEQPLENVRHEKFCQLVLAGYAQADAYREAGFESSDASIHAAASRLAARPEVKSRIKALQLDSIAGSGPLTPAEIRRKLETLFRTSSSSSDVIKALQELNDQTGLLDDIKREREKEKLRPDPCAIITYICSFAGRKGAEIIQELGGKDFIEAKLSDILKVPVRIG